MKTVGIEKTTIASCVKDAQEDRVLLTRHGKPVAMVIGLEDMDEEQLALGHSEAFWKLIRARRAEDTLTRAELEEAIAKRSDRRKKSPKKAS
jgi:antitoxin (DNA-binding transcriptional repressor) of toxin-antitoxin stability system